MENQPILPSFSGTSQAQSHTLETLILNVHALAVRSALRKIDPKTTFKLALEVSLRPNGQGFGSLECSENP